MAEARIGTVDLPDRMELARYFREHSYLELSALFGGPLKPGAIARWAAAAPAGSLGLVAPWVLTQRQPPATTKSWTHDAAVGDFRDSPLGREALTTLRAAVDQLKPAHVVFRSPPLFAPSAAHRDRLRAFFGEVATAEAVGVSRVWVPDGLWEPRSAVAFATELGITCAIDPLVRDPGEPPEIYFELEAPELYFRISGLGRAGIIRPERLDELAELIEHYAEVPITVAFESPSRWNDARNLKKLLADAVED